MVKLFSIFIFCPFLLFGQSSIDNAINYLQRFTIEEADWEQTSISLNDFSEAPLQINNIEKFKAAEFQLMSSRQILSIKKHIRINGFIYSKYELEVIPGFNTEFVKILEPFISFEDKPIKPILKSEILYKTSYLIQNPNGFSRSDSGKYLGSKLHNTARIKISKGNTKSVLIWDKDKGELAEKSFLKFAVEHRINKHIQQVNIGSFSLNIGEGLIHSNRFISAKNAPIQSFYKVGSPIKINASANEDNYENGIAIVTNFNKLRSTYFFSKKRLHGSKNDSILSSIKTDGLFRTYSDIEKRNIGQSTLFGSSQSLKLNQLTISANTVISQLTTAYSPNFNYYNSEYGFRKLFNNSLSFRYFNDGFIIKGETAIDKNLNLTTTNSIAYQLDYISFTTNFRYFSPRYNAYRPNTLSEGSRVQNEKGFFFATEFNEGRFQFYGSIDLYAFTNPRYLVHLPSFGKEYLSYLNIKLSNQSALKLFYKHEKKQSDYNLEIIDQIKSETTQRFYLQFRSELDSDIRLTTRFDFSHFKSSESFKGNSVYIDLRKKNKFQQFGGRVTFFNTDNWDTRIYLYEQDVLYHFSVPSFYDKGVRYYFNYNLKLTKNLRFWIKYGKTIYAIKKSIGSGNDEIQGNLKSDLRVQMKISF